MPATLLVGIVLISVLVNVGLIVKIGQTDGLTLRLPRFLRAPADRAREDPQMPPAPPRRRTLSVAASQSRPAMVAPPAEWTRPEPRPVSETLPPELAEMLSRPPEMAARPVAIATSPRGEGFVGLPHRGSAADQLTGLESSASWGRILETENARLLRYRRPVTIVMADVEGLGRLSGQLGPEPVQRLLPVVAGAFAREARSSDWIAHLGEGRFAALLPETDEIQAINYVERVRGVCEPWLVSAAVPLRLAIGWSSPSPTSDMEFAVRRAEERMHADRRIPGRPIQPPHVVPGAFVTLASAAPRPGGEGEAAPNGHERPSGQEAGDEQAVPRRQDQSRGRSRRRRPDGSAGA